MNISFVKDRFHSLVLSLKNKPSYVQTFLQGMGLVVFFMLVLFSWIIIKTDETAKKVDSLALSKTTMLELPKAEQATGSNTPSIKLSQEQEILALTPAPIDGFFEDVGGQYLPKKNDDGKTPFDVYKRPFQRDLQKSIVSIVVMDFGLSHSLSDKMINTLPADVTFVLNPYSNDNTKWAASARAFGHEFWLTLPMQTKNLAMDTGPMTILKNAVEQQNVEILKSILASSSGYVGVVSTVDHDFEKNANSIKPLMMNIANRGLGFVEINPEMPPIWLSEFSAAGVPYGQNNFWLDHDLKPKSIESAFIKLEQKAKRDGNIIVFTRPYPIVLKAIADWSKTLEEKNIQLAPLSAAVKPE